MVFNGINYHCANWFLDQRGGGDGVYCAGGGGGGDGGFAAK